MKRFIVLFFLLTINSCQLESIEYTKAIVETFDAENIMQNSATIGGWVFTEGGNDVSECGLVWSKNSNPTINDTKIILGSRLDYFKENFEDFETSTTYYYCAYAINSVGVSYGETKVFTTQNEAPCSYDVDNFLSLGTHETTIGYVAEIDNHIFQSQYGNLLLETGTGFSGNLYLEFHEINGKYPKTGEYTVVSEFDRNAPSKGETRVYLANWNIYSAGHGFAPVGSKLYLINNNEKITFIFCDLALGDVYLLNGKYSKNL